MSVEQAAERLRMDHYDDDMAPLAEITKSYLDDLERVKQAYLGLFDSVPLSEEILLASGWPQRECGEFLCPQFSDNGLLVERHKNSGFALRCEMESDQHHIAWIKTVGDLRRLISALHIDCEVVVPESEAKQ